MSKLRTSSPTVPKNGEPVTGFFCGAVSSLSGVLNDTSASPLYALLAFGLLALGVAALAVRTQWRPTVPTPLRRERAAGQIIDTSFRVYWEHKWLLVPIGLVAVLTGSIAVAAQALLFNATDLREAFDALEDDKIEGFVALLVGSVAHGFAPLIVGAAVVLVLRAIDRGERPGAEDGPSRPQGRDLEAPRPRPRRARRRLPARGDDHRPAPGGEEGRRLGARPAVGGVRGPRRPEGLRREHGPVFEATGGGRLRSLPCS